MTAARAGRWHVLAIIVIVRIAMGYQFQAAPSLTPFLMDAFQIDFAAAGTLIGLYLLPGLVLAVPGGFLSRWVGDKRLALGALLLMAAGGFLSGSTDTYDLAWWGRLMAGCGVVLMFTMMTKTIGDWFQGRELFIALSLFLNGWPIGMGIGLLVQPPIADAFGWQWVFLSTGFLCAAAMLAFGGFYPAGQRADTGGHRLTLSWREAALVSISGIMWGTMNGAHQNVHGFAATWLEKFMPRLEAAATVSSNIWAIMIGIPLGGLLIARLGRPNWWMTVCPVLSAASMVMIVLDDNPVLWLSATGFLLFLPSGIVPVLPMEATRDEARNLGIGIFYAWWFAGLALLPVLGGWIADLTGETAAPMYVAAALMLSVPLWLGLFRWLQRGAPPVA
jgi:predicted MFS family arabinose efflux permease